MYMLHNCCKKWIRNAIDSADIYLTHRIATVAMQKHLEKKPVVVKQETRYFYNKMQNFNYPTSYKLGNFYIIYIRILYKPVQKKTIQTYFYNH